MRAGVGRGRRRRRSSGSGSRSRTTGRSRRRHEHARHGDGRGRRADPGRLGGSPLQPLFGSAIFTAWQLDAIAVAVLVLVAVAYLTGVALVPVRTPGERWPVRHTAAFLAGLAVCGFATNGSIAVYDQVLFTAHMAGHLALVMLAPALLVAGRPLTLLLAASAPDARARFERVLRGRVVALLTAPPVALATYTAVIVGSHLTGLMDTIMRNTWAGQLEHVVYVLAGCQFFVLVIGAEPIRWRLGSPARWLLLAIAMAVDTFTGIALMQGTSAVHVLPVRPGRQRAVRHPHRRRDHVGRRRRDHGRDHGRAGRRLAARGRRPRRPIDGWLEQARSATFAIAHRRVRRRGVRNSTRTTRPRAAYNEWLARLDRHAADSYSTPMRERRLEVVPGVGAERDVGVGVHDPGHLRQPAGDDVGDRLELAHPHDRDQVGVTGDGVHLAHAVQPGDGLGHLGDLVRLDGDHHDRGDHAALPAMARS